MRCVGLGAVFLVVACAKHQPIGPLPRPSTKATAHSLLIPARTLPREPVATDSSLYRLLRDKRQPRLLPGVEASDYVDHILKTGSLQQAACDHAAISALAVNSDGKVAIDFGRRDLEVIQRPPGCAFDVPRIPFRLA